MSSIRQRLKDDWNGAVASRWLTNQEWFDRALTGYGDAVLKAAAAQPGEVVLDVGCGAGGTTLELARQVAPSGRVTGVDISEPLLGRARERAQRSGLGITFELADAGRHPFAPETFDLLFSRFGVMFFDEPMAAFTNLHRALKRTGRLAFICWRAPEENDWFTVPLAAVRDILSPPPFDPVAPGPFAFAERGRIESILHDNGFTAVDIAPFDSPLVRISGGESHEATLDDAVEQALRIGPVARMLEERTDDVRKRALDAVRAALEARSTTDGLTLGGAGWIVTARA